MHEVVRSLENERVGDLNRPRVALCLYARAAVDVLVADERAQGYRGLCAYRREVAEAHGDGLCEVCEVCEVCGVVWGASRCEEPVSMPRAAQQGIREDGSLRDAS